MLAFVWLRKGVMSRACIRCSTLVCMHIDAPLFPSTVRQLAMLCIASGCQRLVHPKEQRWLLRTQENILLVYKQSIPESDVRMSEAVYFAQVIRFMAGDFSQVIRSMGSAGLGFALFTVSGDDEIEAMLKFEILSTAWRYDQNTYMDLTWFYEEAQRTYYFFRRRMGHRALRTVEAAHLLGAIQQAMGIDASKMLGRRLRTCAMPRCSLGDAGGSTLWTCSGCNAAHYCCQRHQTAHWLLGHRKECRRLRAAKVIETLVGGAGLSGIPTSLL